MTLLEIIKDYPMSADYETEWIPAYVHPIGRNKRSEYARAIQIDWKAVIGLLNGTIIIYGTNSLNSRVEIATINVNSSDNTQSAVIESLPLMFSYWKVAYKRNGIVTGNLNTFITYNSINN
jgi:hypothetical protein